MRKMQDYIVRGKQVVVGLEDSKRTWRICVRSMGMIVDQTSLAVDFGNLRTYLVGHDPDCTIQVIYEAGFQGFWLHDDLQASGIDCVVTPAHTVTQEKVSTVKTDRVDARRLAKILETRDYKRCAVPDGERRADRQLVRTLNQIQRDIIATKNRIRKFLDFHGLNGDFPPGAWKSSDYARVRTLRLSGSLQFCLDTYVMRLDELTAHRSRLHDQLKMLCDKERYRAAVRIKESFGGVGWLSAIRFTLEWGELSRFPNGKCLSSFLGLAPREHSTGDTVHKGHISKQGNAQVRAWLIQCAWRALSRDRVLLDKFERVRRSSGSKKKAIVAVARKMAVRMRALELANQPYCNGVVE